MLFPLAILAVLSAFALVAVRGFQAGGERRAALRWLGGTDAEYEVLVEGERVPDPGPLLAALRTLSWQSAHHSHPTTPLHVEVRSRSGALTLIVARDSSRPEEYWVFVPRKTFPQASPLGLEIGRIHTAAFRRFEPGK